MKLESVEVCPKCLERLGLSYKFGKDFYCVKCNKHYTSSESKQQLRFNF